MKCPYCSGDLWDNRNKKDQSPKRPKFVCKDQDGCGAAGWFDKKDPTKVVFKKGDETKVVSLDESATPNKPKANPNNSEEVNKGYFAAWAKDLTVVSLEKGIAIAKNVDEVFTVFENFYNKLDKFLNTKVPSSIEKTKEVVETKKESNNSVSIDDEMILTDLD